MGGAFGYLGGLAEAAAALAPTAGEVAGTLAGAAGVGAAATAWASQAAQPTASHDETDVRRDQLLTDTINPEARFKPTPSESKPTPSMTAS